MPIKIKSAGYLERLRSRQAVIGASWGFLLILFIVGIPEAHPGGKVELVSLWEMLARIFDTYSYDYSNTGFLGYYDKSGFVEIFAKIFAYLVPAIFVVSWIARKKLPSLASSLVLILIYLVFFLVLAYFELVIIVFAFPFIAIFVFILLSNFIVLDIPISMKQ